LPIQDGGLAVYDPLALHFRAAPHNNRCGWIGMLPISSRCIVAVDSHREKPFVDDGNIRTCSCKEGSVRDQALAPAETTRPWTGRDSAVVVAASPLADASKRLASVPLMVRRNPARSLCRSFCEQCKQKNGYGQQLRILKSIQWSTSPLLPEHTLHNCWPSFVYECPVLPTQDVFNEDFLFSSSSLSSLAGYLSILARFGLEPSGTIWHRHHPQQEQ
jgi:hypothetical protein